MFPHKSFYFLRHGETAWNAKGLGQGSSDIPLNEKGLAQARHAALVLSYYKDDIGEIVSSPLVRARKTAEIVAEKLGKPVRILATLQEVALGHLEGVPFPPLETFIPHWSATEQVAGGEPSYTTKKRIVEAMTDVLQFDEKPPLVVVHGFFYMVLNELMHFPPFFPTNATPMKHEALRHSADRRWMRSILTVSENL